MHPIWWVLIILVVLWALGAGFFVSPGWLLVLVLVLFLTAAGTRGRGRYPY